MASASDIVPVDEIKDLLTCSMCSQTLSEPRSLPCLHNFCKVCLGNYVKRLRGGDKNVEKFPCPTCHSTFTLKSDEDVTQLTSNHFVSNMVEILVMQQKTKESTACSRCQGPAVNVCASCEILMCSKCSEMHDNWFTMKKHRVLSVHDLSDPETAKSKEKKTRKFYCMKHEDKILEIYCETCKELCCIHCMFSNHLKQNHSCVAVSEVAQKQREELQANRTTLREKLSEGNEALNNIGEVMKTLEKNAKTAKDQIKEQKENIMKIVAKKLDEKAENMNGQVDKVYSEMHSELSKQNDDIKDYLRKVEDSASLPKNLLKGGSIEEIFSSRKMIDENIKQLNIEQPEDLAAINDGAVYYVPDDISNLNLNAIVGKMGQIQEDPSSKLKKSSNVLKGEIGFIKQLQKWLGEKCKWNLCYRASRDGWTAQDFHRYCDNKGPTVVLVKVSNYIFGGYTDENWQATGKYKRSHAPFLFSLRNKDNLAPFIANIKQGQDNQAIYCSSGYGPTFGGGHDLHICSNPQANQSSSSNFGNTYQPPPGYVYGSEQANNLLAGQNQFLATEIEVFN